VGAKKSVGDILFCVLLAFRLPIGTEHPFLEISTIFPPIFEDLVAEARI
jgi:hypothetical protein